jgi:hypothetical protein
MIGQRRRHSRLHEALVNLDATHQVQVVEIPEELSAQYYQKYVKMLAARWGMDVHTRTARGASVTHMMIVERAR